MGVPQSAIMKIEHKRLQFHAYKVQIVKALQPNDRTQSATLAEEVLRIDTYKDYL